MTYSIIGTGNIAWFLGNRLISGQHHCTGVYSRNTAAAETLAESLLCEKFGSIADISDEDADICFMAVSDSAIPVVSQQLNFANTVLIHTAGAVDIESIAMAAKHRAVLWPVYSIVKNNLPDHRNIPCAWEATPGKATSYVQETGHAITDMLFEAHYEQRKWLHLSAVMSNNFVNHLLGICEQICADNNLPFSLLMPIIEQTFDRIRHTSPMNSQTGPAARNDTVTIQNQLALLAQHPRWQNVYKAITDSIQWPG